MAEQKLDSVVLVTGAGGNLGSAVARELARTSARLVCVEHNSQALEKLADNLPDSSEILKIGGIDLADLTSCREVVEKTLARFGRLDALANTVGGFQMGPVGETGLEQWEQLFHMNARTAYTISAAVLKPMQNAGYGRIVHVAAAPGLKAGANQAAYAASKGAVIRLTEAIAAENRDKRITANCILPGTIDTPQNRSAMPNAKMDNWVQPIDIAKLIGFLISPEAGIVTGAAIPATGRV
ncbi:SDR family NAD(P)-dependent oxidoreductase [Phyllobacterium sp. 0TCS1.6C]|uniref:SDR family NAD(P)-dependent oxidoreductase n=1 Tax=unclassified Phyllobacterium TaxID=2638441 RepID=UPI0022645CEE|nr:MULTISPECIES: SDR family NAD(P)-dependent oxidoreductase [unclassified Phyllobacterium]MCX8279276.1 SDR family NAD(P)-dependent oxidoreductase [Phyllobacterium sp. 0TCS1.6C]MCX8294060.1 SDR family NAD(P)-dependent oxidoreductase [Phyllobacterium sp. 0TCS1.6A]